jgi:murein DD-endopeptidase MepM/ murein hydrolase activator NlpD
MGDDLNGIGGMNTDLGDPVFSIADGLVVYAGEPSPGWGNVVVVAHRVADGRRLESMYAHLSEIFMRPGALVARGERVGTVGTANGNYPAHLHFEVRTGGGIEIGPGYSMNPLNRLDPAKLVYSLRNAAAHDLSPSPLAKLLQSARPPR